MPPLDFEKLPPEVLQEISRLQRSERRAKERLKAALDQLGENELAQQEAGIAGDRALGRPALSEYRRLGRDFTDTLLQLPVIRRRAGLGAVRAKVATNLLQDLALLELEAPRGVLQVLEREKIRRFLVHPAFQRLISAEGPAADYARTLLQERVSEAYVRSGARRVFEKSTEHYEDQSKGRRR